VLGAIWAEFDLSAGIWTVPGARMKGGEDHVLYLSPRAREILEGQRAVGQPFVFLRQRLTAGHYPTWRC